MTRLTVLITCWVLGASAGHATTPADADFQTRCSGPGVIRCHGFEPDTRFNINDGSYAHNFDFDYLPAGGTDINMSIDTSQKASGSSSLMAFIPATSGADGSGSFLVRFSDDGKLQLGLNEEFYVQWRQRFTPEMLHPYASTNYAQGTAWKQTIIGAGDVLDGDGNPSAVSYSCTILEMVSNSAPLTRADGIPNLRYGFYHSCGYYFGMDYWFTPVNQIIMQHQGPPYCVYPDDPQDGCMEYTPNEWMTFQVHIKIGSRWATGPNDPVADSKVDVWVAREGQPSVHVYDSSQSHPDGFPIINDSVPLKYGKVWLLPYMSYRDDTVTYADAFTWYDELIISRQRIAEPGASLGPRPSSPTSLHVQ